MKISKIRKIDFLLLYGLSEFLSTSRPRYTVDIGPGVDQPFGRCVRWIGQWRTKLPTACSSVPHSQAAEGAIPYLRKQERRRPIPERRRLREAHAVLGTDIPGGFWRCWRWKYGVPQCCPTTLHSNGDPCRLPHICCFLQMNLSIVVRRVRMVVFIWDAVRSHRGDRWKLSGADVAGFMARRTRDKAAP